MSSHAERKPYPHIPVGHLQEDVPLYRDELPTRDTTVLFTSAEKMVMGHPERLKVVEAGKGIIDVPPSLDSTTQQPFFLLARVIGSEDSHTRKEALRVLQIYSRAAFPHNYDLVSRQLFLQHQSGDDRVKQVYKHVAQEIEVLIEPPQHISLSFLFEEHTINIEKPNAYEAKKEKMRDDLYHVFTTGEKNILVIENVEKGFSAKLFLDGLKKYKSFTQALYYTNFVLQFRIEPTDADLAKVGDIARVTRSFHPQGAYFTALYETLDELKNDGYDVQVAFENGRDIELSTRFHTVDDVLNWYQKKQENNKKRERVVGELITGIAEKYRDSSRKVNIATIFGTEHYNLPGNLPAVLLEKVEKVGIVDETYLTHPLIQYARGHINREELAKQYKVSVA